jgi:hypothetical protein
MLPQRGTHWRLASLRSMDLTMHLKSLGRLLKYVSRSNFATLEAHGVIHPDEGWHDVYVPQKVESWVPGGI